MLIIKKELTVDTITYGENDAEVLCAKVKKDSNKCCNVIVSYVPPKTNAWEETEYTRKLENTKIFLYNMLQGSDPDGRF